MNIKTVAAFAVGPIGAAIIGFASLPILAWYFTAEDIGRISMLQVVSSAVVLLFSLGLDQAYVREYHEAVDQPTLLRTVLLPGIIFFVFTVVGVFLYSPQLLSKSLFAIDSTSFSILVVICFLSSFFSRFLSLILRMRERGLAFSMSQILPKVLFLLVIGSYILSESSLDFQKLLIAQVISIVTVFLIFTWNTRSDWLPAFSQKINYTKLNFMLSFGLPLIVGGIASWALMVMDRIFLRNLSNFNELGIYSIAVSIAAVTGIVSSVFTTVWAPTVFKWAAEGENLEKVDQVSEHVLAAVYFILCLSGMFSWLIPYALPEIYVSVQYLIVACMIAPLFYMVSETTAIGISISRKTNYALAASGIAAAVNALGCYLLVARYGAAGAAVSTAFAFWIFVVARTEFSCLAWRRIPRLKMYMITFLILCCSIFFAVIGANFPNLFVLLWVIFFVGGLFIFHHSINSVKSLIVGLA